MQKCERSRRTVVVSARATLRPQALLLVALSAAALAPACGNSKHDFGKKPTGMAGAGGTVQGPSGEAGATPGTPDATAGTTSATAGTTGATTGSGGTGQAGEGGAGAEAGSTPLDGGAGPTIQPDCAFNQTTCIGNAPATCNAGSWVVGKECSGALPACSNGACANARVLGGIVTLAPVTGAKGAVRVVDQSFNIAGTSCGLVAGGQVCVTGGIKP